MENCIIIIGGGASGLMAAIAAARRGAGVIVLEHKDRVGKKLLATGNGRCNYTNLNQKPEYYFSDNPTFPGPVLEAFSAADTLAFFEAIGVMGRDRDGYVYPASGQAASVLEALILECRRLKVALHCGVEVKRIRPQQDGFQVAARAAGSDRVFAGKAVILATGSKASPVTGSDGSGYRLAADLGHRIIAPAPSLVQLMSDAGYFKKIAGVRIQGAVSLFVDGIRMAADKGEIQMTDYGISGIPVFQVSRFAGKAGGKCKITASLDFMPDMSAQDLAVYLHQRKKQLGYRACEDFLLGLFPQKMNQLFLMLAGIQPQQRVAQLSHSQLDRLGGVIKALIVPITGTKPFTNAQVCSGGVDTSEIDPVRMESLKVGRLFFAGEIVDVDGLCGGYNLQWAWSSGYAAGSFAANIESTERGVG